MWRAAARQRCCPAGILLRCSPTRVGSGRSAAPARRRWGWAPTRSRPRVVLCAGARACPRPCVDLAHRVEPFTTGALGTLLDRILERLHARVGPSSGDDLALV